MALLRSDVLNRDLIEQVLRRREGTSKVTLLTLTVGKGWEEPLKPTLLEDRLTVEVTAKVRGAEKTYVWTAKMPKSELRPRNFSKFQGLIQTESKFYTSLLPELKLLGSRLPTTHDLIHADSETPNHEIILLSDSMYERGFRPAIRPELDLNHICLAVEWLATLHGLSYVAMQKHPEGPEGWIRDHPWVRRPSSGKGKTATVGSNTEFRREDEGIRSRFMSMAAETIRTNDDRLAQLLAKQDWMEQMKAEKVGASAFKTICHGEPWFGNLLFRYGESETHRSIPQESMFSDFQSCIYANPGYDLAHLLLSSTTRDLRQRHLDLILQSYLTELDDVIGSQGEDNGVYSMDDLVKDYKAGMIVGISFCVFALPVLTEGAEEGDTADSVTGLSEATKWRIVEAVQDAME